MKKTLLFFLVIGIVLFSLVGGANAQSVAPVALNPDDITPFLGVRYGKQKITFSGGSEAERDITLVVRPDGSGKLTIGRYDLPGGKGTFGGTTSFKKAIIEKGRLAVANQNQNYYFAVREDGKVFMEGYLSGKTNLWRLDDAILELR